VDPVISVHHDQARHDDLPAKDRPASELDDERDRDELRERYYGLLQELRVVLPGTQVLVAFLLTVPFANRFAELDDVGTTLYGVALGAGTLAVLTLVAPTVFHRVAARRSRRDRLIWGIRLTRVGLVLLAISLSAALGVVARLVFGPTACLVAIVVTIVATGALWVVLPIGAGRRDER
jgi:hypothetical protein